MIKNYYYSVNLYCFYVNITVKNIYQKAVLSLEKKK